MSFRKGNGPGQSSNRSGMDVSRSFMTASANAYATPMRGGMLRDMSAEIPVAGQACFANPQRFGKRNVPRRDRVPPCARRDRQSFGFVSAQEMRTPSGPLRSKCAKVCRNSRISRHFFMAHDVQRDRQSINAGARRPIGSSTYSNEYEKNHSTIGRGGSRGSSCPQRLQCRRSGTS